MAKRRKKRNNRVLFIIIPVVLALLVGSGFLVNEYILTGENEDFTTLSLTSADFRSKSEFFNEKTWILYVSQGGMAQNAEGKIDKEDVDQESGSQPKNDLFIDIGYSTQTCEYPIVKDYNSYPIKKFDLRTWGKNLISGCEWDEHCSNYNWHGQYHLTTTCFCIEETAEYPVATYESPRTHTEAEIVVEAKGEQYTTDFDTRGETKGFVGSNVYYKWDGYKATAMSCPEKNSQYKATYYNGQWKGISNQNYERYVNHRDSIDLLIGTKPKKDHITEQMSILNTYSTQALSQVYPGTIENSNSLQSAVLVTELDSNTMIPTYVFYVKADWLGIYQPVGEPKITDIKTSCFKTGENGKVDVYVKNIGDERDGFAVNVNCPSPFTEDPTVEKVVQPGMTERFTIGLYADVSQKTEKTCTVKAVGLDKTDEKTFKACADPQVVCQANRWSCDDNKVMKCNEFGSANDLVDTCTPNEECVYAPDGRAYCEVITTKEKVCDDRIDNDGDGRTDCEDKDCDGKECKLTDSEYGVCEEGTCIEGGECNLLNPLTWWTCIKIYVIDKFMKMIGNFLLPFKIIGGLIIGLIGFTSTLDLTSKRFKKKKERN